MQSHHGQHNKDLTREPVGFIVDSAVADALGLPFTVEAVPLAHIQTSQGMDVLVAKRSRSHAVAETGAERFGEIVEALESRGVRQIVAVAHRLLLSPSGTEDDLDRPADDEALTVGILPFGACRRLLSATFDRIENNTFVDGVFLRSDDDGSDFTLLEEGRAARMTGICICLVEATTLRCSLASTASEVALADILLSIPDALSPTSSCYCHTSHNVQF